jgi:hypothetical protein
MIISSPEVALFTAICIEPPGWTEISAAVTIPEPDIKIRKTASNIINLFIQIPPYIQESMD